jgi:hypothetical protein
MKKDLRKELQEMKFLFGYKAGRVISEQNMPKMEEGLDDIMFAEPGVAEPEVKPDTDTDTEKRRTFDPSRRERDPGRLPYEDPDTHPQGRFDDETNEPFTDDVDSEYENSDLADLVKKYLSKRG